MPESPDNSGMETTKRHEPLRPVPGIVLHDFRIGDRVRVLISGRTGTLVRRLRHSWVVRWDEPVFGVAEGRISTVNIEPETTKGAGDA
jgi:hypothetical protein